MTSQTAGVVAQGFSLLEGPRWAHDALYVSDFFNHRVMRFSAPVTQNFTTVCDVPGQPSGLAIDDDGNVFIAVMLDRTLSRWNGTAMDIVADLSMIPGPVNDMAMDSRGRCYVGNFGLIGGTGTHLLPTPLLVVQPDGSVEIAADELIFPNGIVLSADERTLFVAETYAARVTAFAVGNDGLLSNRRVWADFADSPVPPQVSSDIPAATSALPCLPDGICLDVEEAIWVADAKGNGIARVREGGEVLDFVGTGDLSVYAAALGGPELRTLYLCCAPATETFDPATSSRSVLMSCDVDVPGVPRY